MPKAVHPIDRMVGLNIRIFRLAKDMSQTELGKAIGDALMARGFAPAKQACAQVHIQAE